MERDPRTYIWDARRAAELIGTFVAERSWDDYQADAMLRSAVERQFEIVGEALNNLRQTDATLAEQITDLSRIVAFRNLLIHGYATVNDRIVWEVATERVHRLLITLGELLGEAHRQEVSCEHPPRRRPRAHGGRLEQLTYCPPLPALRQRRSADASSAGGAVRVRRLRACEPTVHPPSKAPQRSEACFDGTSRSAPQALPVLQQRRRRRPRSR